MNAVANNLHEVQSQTIFNKIDH